MRWLGLMAVGAWLASSAAAQAQERGDKTGPALNWTRQPGAESCIASVELAARIEARVKRRIFVAAPQAIVAVEGYVAPLPGGGFRASIAMSDGEGALYGSRELTTAGACSELDDGLVFVIAVTLRPESGSGTGIELPENVASALDALFGAEPTEPEPSAFPSAPAGQAADRAPIEPRPVPQPEPVQEQEDEPDEAREGAPFLYLEALGVGHLGLQPIGSLGGGAGVRVYIAGIGSIALRAAVLADTARDIQDRGRDSHASFSGRLVSGAYCTPSLLEWSALSLEACGAFSLGSIDATGVDFVREEQASSVFGSAGLAPRLAIAATDTLVVALAVGPELHVARPVFVYGSQRDGDVELYRATLLGAGAELSVAFALF